MLSKEPDKGVCTAAPDRQIVMNCEVICADDQLVEPPGRERQPVRGSEDFGAQFLCRGANAHNSYPTCWLE